VTLRRDGAWKAGRLDAVTIAGNGIPRPDPDGTARSLVRRLSREDFGKHAMQVSASGELRRP
jgi:hypothetical protein